MICFYTRVNVDEQFNKDILLNMFIEWLNSSSKNRMEGLDYNNEDSYIYKLDNKVLKIEDFNDYDVFAVQFVLNDYSRKSYFKVEVIYSYKDHGLELGFYKEINEESQFIDKISIPRIFKELLSSTYIVKDNDLEITKKPLFIQTREYHNITANEHQLPLIVLNRNKRCIVDPNKLNEEVFGIGHVLCVLNKKELEAKIIYPDGFIETVEEDKPYQMIKDIREKVRSYMIEESYQSYAFDDYMKLKLHKEHQIKADENKELRKGFLEEIDELKELVTLLQQEYEEKKDIYTKLLEESNYLEQQLSLESKEPLLVLKTQDNEEYKQLVINTLTKFAKGLPLEDRFRKRDVLYSILENQQ